MELLLTLVMITIQLKIVGIFVEIQALRSKGPLSETGSSVQSEAFWANDSHSGWLGFLTGQKIQKKHWMFAAK